MRRLLLIGLVSLAACAPASTPQGNSPAERLYVQASQLLRDHYYGFSKSDLPATLEKYRLSVRDTCAGKSDCPYEVTQAALAKLTEELKDPHTYFENPEEFAASQRLENGQGAAVPRLGVSWIFREGSNGWLITDTVAGLPAQQIGLARGDLVVGLNGTALPKGVEQSNAALQKAIRGGNPFTLSVKRVGKSREVKAQGKLVNLPPLPYQRRWDGLPANIALLRIADFSPPTVAKEFHRLVNLSSNTRGIIVDLRDNPGGRLTECTAAAGAFLEKLEVSFSSRDGDDVYSYANGRVSIDNRTAYTINPVALYKGKVAVLINADSASCSEMMAASLQFFKRATIVGEPSFGILNTGTFSFPLADGSGLTITSIRTLNPDRKPYPERVTPNVAQKDDLNALETGAKDVMLERAVQVLQGADASSQPIAPVSRTALSLVNLRRYAMGY